MTLTAERKKLRYKLKKALYMQRQQLKRDKLRKKEIAKTIKHYQKLLKKRKK